MRLPPLEHHPAQKQQKMTTEALNDTICAISTPPGVGGIAVARISGPQAIDIADSIWNGLPLAKAASHTAHLGIITDAQGRELDQAVATVFRAPHSFTGDDVVELSVHGSRYVQRELIHTLISHGARMATAGEFTRRAFAAGRMDLAEAEAVADVIASDSRAALRIVMTQMRGGVSQRLATLRERLVDLAALLELELDFSEEDVEFADRTRLIDLAEQVHSEVERLYKSFRSGQAIKEGIPVAIVGATNAGKSSLLNALLDDDRAIVSDIHGTTRDTIEETMVIGDYRFRIIDTAGLRDTADRIEQIGIERSRQAIAHARIVICVIDSTAPLPDGVLHEAAIPALQNDGYLIALLNKSDLHADEATVSAAHAFAGHSDIASGHIATIAVSASLSQGIDSLRDSLVRMADCENAASSDDILITNARHAAALSAAAQSSQRAIEALRAQIPGDLIAQDIRETIHHLSSITGDIPSAEILTTIFSRFCIGK